MHGTKIYLRSLLKDPLTLIKFGYIWLFFQPTKDTFAKTILSINAESEKLLNEYIKDENVSHEELGYDPDSLMIDLRNNANTFVDDKR